MTMPADHNNGCAVLRSRRDAVELYRSQYGLNSEIPSVLRQAVDELLAILPSHSVARGVMAEYLPGGDQDLEECDCGWATRRIAEGLAERVREASGIDQAAEDTMRLAEAREAGRQEAREKLLANIRLAAAGALAARQRWFEGTMKAEMWAHERLVDIAFDERDREFGLWARRFTRRAMGDRS